MLSEGIAKLLLCVSGFARNALMISEAERLDGENAVTI